MFNDDYGLTQAVLDGRKTMTRRIIKCPRTFRGEWVAGFNVHIRQSDKKIVDYPCMYDADGREFDGGEILPKYKIGEVVAIAQSYMDVDRFAAYEDTTFNMPFEDPNHERPVLAAIYMPAGSVEYFYVYDGTLSVVEGKLNIMGTDIQTNS